MRHGPDEENIAHQRHLPSTLKCLVYVGLPDNPQFLGLQDPDELARRILASTGPSGENRVYLYELAQALLSLSAESGDEHVSDLVRRCKELERTEVQQVDGRHQDGDDPVQDGLHRVGSTEEQEEIEK